MADVQRKLGYRFTLAGGTFPTTARAGGRLPIVLTLTNHGWSAPYNPRPVRLVLREVTSGAERSLPLAADPRHWPAGETVGIRQAVQVPRDLPAGTYALLLDLPDPSPRLNARPDFKIRLANDGLWEPGTGYNDLRHSVTIR